MKVIFLYDEMLDGEYRKKSKVPLQFISFGFVRGKMFKTSKSKTPSVIAIQDGDIVRTWGNNKIYGALFAIPEYEYYIKILDAMYGCSKSRININHNMDYAHRVKTEFTPITFDNLDRFSVLDYTRNTPLEVDAYFANTSKDFINGRVKSKQYRKGSGVLEHAFKSLYEEVENG